MATNRPIRMTNTPKGNQTLEGMARIAARRLSGASGKPAPKSPDAEYRRITKRALRGLGR